jgi:hypothetical protein
VAVVDELALALELLADDDDFDEDALGCDVAGALVAAGCDVEVRGSLALVSPLGFTKSA